MQRQVKQSLQSALVSWHSFDSPPHAVHAIRCRTHLHVSFAQHWALRRHILSHVAQILSSTLYERILPQHSINQLYRAHATKSGTKPFSFQQRSTMATQLLFAPKKPHVFG
jgi:hypothetical protein